MPTKDLLERIQKLATLYFKQLLLIGEQTNEKRRLLGQLASVKNSSVINLNLKLSRRLKNIPRNDRCFYVQDLIDEIIREMQTEYIFLDSIEILFSPHLKMDPLGQLKSISKYRPLVAAWNGRIENGYLIYGETEHPDYVSYKLSELDCQYYEIEGGLV